MNGNIALIRSLIVNTDYSKWSVQGLGMMRLYIGETDRSFRLHIWNDALRIPGVSPLHTHPWHFNSNVIVGHITDVLFKSVGFDEPYAEKYMKAGLKCGENAALLEEPELVYLKRFSHMYTFGESYHRCNYEIHTSEAGNGTVTLVKREVPVGGNPDNAYVFWPKGDKFVSAEPRQATKEEWLQTTDLALEALK